MSTHRSSCALGLLGAFATVGVTIGLTTVALAEDSVFAAPDTNTYVEKTDLTLIESSFARILNDNRQFEKIKPPKRVSIAESYDDILPKEEQRQMDPRQKQILASFSRIMH